VRRVTFAAAVDAALIIVFAALGRRAHDEGSAASEALVVAAPFLAGYAVGWAAARLDRAPLDLRRAAVAWAVGIPLGLLLRGLVFGRGVAPTFVVVALAVTGLLLLGWRAAVARVAARRRAGDGRPAAP
jgi:DUF3054 family protein